MNESNAKTFTVLIIGSDVDIFSELNIVSISVYLMELILNHKLVNFLGFVLDQMLLSFDGIVIGSNDGAAVVVIVGRFVVDTNIFGIILAHKVYNEHLQKF